MSEHVDLNSWEEFEERIDGFRNPAALDAGDGLPTLFRGQANTSWPLATTLERSGRRGELLLEYYRLVLRIKPQIEAFTGRKWPVQKLSKIEKLLGEYDRFSLRLTSGPRPAYAYMAYLRQHGFPSPLLDWTRSAYIAAFFAFRGGSRCESVSIFALSRTTFQGMANGTPSIYRLGPYVMTSRRHFLQQSEYTWCLNFDAANGWKLADHGEALSSSGIAGPPMPSGFQLLKFNLPATERLKVLRLLDEHNLNEASLFESEESLMQTLALRELLFRSASSQP